MTDRRCDLCFDYLPETAFASPDAELCRLCHREETRPAAHRKRRRQRDNTLGWARRAARITDRDYYRVPGTDAGPRQAVWVTLYLVHLAYGGAEEGGWWYDEYEPIASVRCRPARREQAMVRLLAQYADRLPTVRERNRSNVYGHDATVVCESRRNSYVAQVRPVYE